MYYFSLLITLSINDNHCFYLIKHVFKVKSEHYCSVLCDIALYKDYQSKLMLLLLPLLHIHSVLRGFLFRSFDTLINFIDVHLLLGSLLLHHSNIDTRHPPHIHLPPSSLQVLLHLDCDRFRLCMPIDSYFISRYGFS